MFVLDIDPKLFIHCDNYIGEMQITNAYDASLLVLNPTMDEAIDFKQK